jgi:hypothetical protein
MLFRFSPDRPPAEAGEADLEAVPISLGLREAGIALILPAILGN